MQTGAIIEKGIIDWQIIQQVQGKAEICLSGYWVPQEGVEAFKVFVRIVKEDTGATVIPWIECEEMEGQKWKVIIKNIPAGGLYRIETCASPLGNLALEWSVRGDMIHHIGVGDLYVIAGQSNSAGYGKDPIFDPPELGVHLFKNSGKWDLASHPMNESTNTIHVENREVANPGNSPYLSFAKQLKRELGYPIGLIQASLGGSPLSAWDPEEDGILYRNMMQIIRSQGNKIKGILWYQGCSDACEGLCDTYLERFKSMVTQIREDLKDESLPVLTVQLNRFVTPVVGNENIYWGKVREAQRQAAKQIHNVFIISSTDSTLSDLIHISSVSNLVLGERFAAVALKHLYQRSYGFDAPDLMAARIADKNTITLSFDHVCDRMYSFDISAEALAISVEDELGFITIQSYTASKNMLTLTLDREVKGSCKVHGASEQNPKPIIPVDFASHMPMLSFYGVEVVE